MKKIRVIKIKPCEIPDVAYIYPTREAILLSVGGDGIPNDNAKMKKIDENIYIIYPVILDAFELEYNRRIDNTSIFGTFVVVETDSEGKPKSMSDENFKKYVNLFWDPEFMDSDMTAELYSDFLIHS